MNKIELIDLELKTFTEQNTLDYCLLNNINSDNIIELWLGNNELTDISGIKLFKNLKILYLWCNNITNISDLKNLKYLEKLYIGDNEIKDISVIKDLINLKWLNLSNNKIKDISVLNYLIKLEGLYIENNKIKDISVIQYLKKLEILNISYLELESDQIQYINSLKNLNRLSCENGFKDIKILYKLNKNINIYK